MILMDFFYLVSILIIAARMSDRECIMCWKSDSYFKCINIQIEIIKVVLAFVVTWSLRNNSMTVFYSPHRET